jgi:hypothetical protein
MHGNGQLRNASSDGEVLRWQGRVVTAEELGRSLNGHQELVVEPRAIVTPLAAEHLRAKGVRITRLPAAGTGEKHSATGTGWGFGQERPSPLVSGAVQAVRRDGVSLKELQPAGTDLPCRWARAVAECVARGECTGGVVFCQDPGLVCCVANKLPGLRAVAAVTAAQAARATLNLGANLVAVEMPGRTFFEVRHILRTLCQTGEAKCPDGVACTLRELDGHAHR